MTTTQRRATGPKRKRGNGRSPGFIRLGKHYPLSREVFEAVCRGWLEDQGVRVRRDRIDRDWRVYQAILQWAHVADSPTIHTTHEQMATAIGALYSKHRGGNCMTLVRALHDLQALGLIHHGEGVTRANGSWVCLEIELRATVGDDASQDLQRAIILLM